MDGNVAAARVTSSKKMEHKSGSRIVNVTFIKLQKGTSRSGPNTRSPIGRIDCRGK